MFTLRVLVPALDAQRHTWEANLDRHLATRNTVAEDLWQVHHQKSL